MRTGARPSRVDRSVSRRNEEEADMAGSDVPKARVVRKLLELRAREAPLGSSGYRGVLSQKAIAEVADVPVRGRDQGRDRAGPGDAGSRGEGGRMRDADHAALTAALVDGPANASSESGCRRLGAHNYQVRARPGGAHVDQRRRLRSSTRPSISASTTIERLEALVPLDGRHAHLVAPGRLRRHRALRPVLGHQPIRPRLDRRRFDLHQRRLRRPRREGPVATAIIRT